jgi:excisionase family DNA binding protein
MGKISIISRRRRGARFPETEAQRRARERELEDTDAQHTLPTDGLTLLPGVLCLELSETLGDDLRDTTTFIKALADAEGLSTTPTAALQIPQDAAVQLRLNPEQSQVLRTLPFVAKPQEHLGQPLAFDVTKLQDEDSIVLQFSLRAEAVPQMLSLQDLCQQLKVGRRSVVRLMRTGKLRYYRIGKRYRFAASEVKQDLEQNVAQEM